MKKILGVIPFAVLLFALMGCSWIFDKATKQITGIDDESMTRTGDLWADVPKMDSLAASDMEIPPMVKLLMRTVLNNLWRANKEGEDKTPVQGDWIVFSTSQTPADVQAFYTNERMTSFGQWEPSKNSTCMDGSDKGVSGVFCVFAKEAANKQAELLIVATHDDEKNQTYVFFLRLEADSPPANSNTKHVAKTHPPAIHPAIHAKSIGYIPRRFYAVIER